MKKIGLIGGITWHSTAQYYQLINEGVARRLGGRHAAQLLVHSFDFHDIDQAQRAGDWEQLSRTVGAVARQLELAGCEGLAICANTMHKVAADVVAAVGVPLLSVIDATAQAARAQSVTRVGLLGTRFTMREPFYRDALQAHDLEVLVPDESDQGPLDNIIFDELVKGSVREPSRDTYLAAIDRLVARGAEAVILGCTEIPLLVRQEHLSIPAIDTLAVHADAIVRFAVS